MYLWPLPFESFAILFAMKTSVMSFQLCQKELCWSYFHPSWVRRAANDDAHTLFKSLENYRQISKPLKWLVCFDRYMTPVLGHTTDLHMCVAENQSRRCGGMELRALECIEYYGRQKGFVICKDLYEDFMECKYNSVQVRTQLATII